MPVYFVTIQNMSARSLPQYGKVRRRPASALLEKCCRRLSWVARAVRAREGRRCPLERPRVARLIVGDEARIGLSHTRLI
jgi:hypothetical protein